MNIDIKKGDKFGFLTVIKEGERIYLPSGQSNRTMYCKCRCGNFKNVRVMHLTRGRIKSCGCIKKTQKGLSKHPLYSVWKGIIERCEGRVEKSVLYKEKGINICDEWLNYENFYYWAIDKYSKGLHLDRKNNYLGYSPENCRFVTPVVNQNNKENTRFINYNGKEYPLMILVREKGLFRHKDTIRGRLKRGWSIEKAIDTPIRKGKYTKIRP